MREKLRPMGKDPAYVREGRPAVALAGEGTWAGADAQTQPPGAEPGSGLMARGNLVAHWYAPSLLVGAGLQQFLLGPDKIANPVNGLSLQIRSTTEAEDEFPILDGARPEQGRRHAGPRQERFDLREDFFPNGHDADT